MTMSRREEIPSLTGVAVPVAAPHLTCGISTADVAKKSCATGAKYGTSKYRLMVLKWVRHPVAVCVLPQFFIIQGLLPRLQIDSAGASREPSPYKTRSFFPPNFGKY
jgi:hypothetical protein